MGGITLEVVVEHRRGSTRPVVIIPASKVARWKLDGTTTVEGTLDGVPLGRRSLKKWDDDRWFLELPSGLVGKRLGATARLVLRLASEELPVELLQVLDEAPAARQRWDGETAAQKRMIREHVLGAKSSDARLRRARQRLLPVTKPKVAKGVGLTGTRAPITVRIVGRRLPGRSCGPYLEVRVGMPLKADREPTVTTAADAREATWETVVEVSARDGVPAFHGPAVHGPPEERFLYLTWIGRKGREAPTMFRRTKLRLDSVPPEVLAAAIRSGLLVGTLDLTAPDGMPVAASVHPPALAWSAG